MAWDVSALDLSFGKSIKVETENGWEDSGQYFLGVAVGHRAIVGAGVQLNYGISIPNESLLVGNSRALIRDASAAQPGRPYRMKNGVFEPVRKEPPGEPPKA